MAKQLTAFEKEQAECAQKINEYKLLSEANIVASIFKKPELMYNIDLKLEDFGHNIWKCWYAVADGLIIKEKKTSLDEISVGIYLEKHPKLRNKIQEYGGYSTINDATAYINLDNFDSYVNDIKKFNVLLQLLKYGFPISEKLSEYIDKTSDEIYSELELMLNHTFLNTESSIKSYNAFENIHQYIDELNSGADIGLPFYGADLLNAETAGMRLGTMTGLGGLSGSGKSLLAFNYLIPSAIENNFPTVFIINEEDEKRYKKEMIIWVANNIFNANITKYQLRNGHFGKELMKIFQQCADWIEEKKEQHILTIVPLQTYSANIAIKVIKKYARMGVQYFVLDTMKPSANAKGEIYQSMMSDAVALYDVIKPTNLNVHLLCTYQLNKSSSKIRKLTSDNIGMAKSIVDVMSMNIMVRHPHADEFAGESHELKCYRLDKKQKIPFSLDKDKSYLIIFITKNRFGRANHQQIIAEFDMGTNKYHEVGYTIIMEDF
jgi:replicative DNA helicase